MSRRTIRDYPIEPINTSAPIDETLATTLLESVAEYREQLYGRRIWLACSGGRDSLALAALCLQLYRRGELPFLPQLLHVNHGLQTVSDDWAQHVERWAQVQQMPCYILPVTVHGHDEQAARQARYQAMLSHINQHDVLMLAHHADDQAETVLMRLIQGAGIKGLSGMQPWREHRTGAQSTHLWRPWLTVSRAEITDYAEHLRLPYINDSTNDDGDNVRSGLRRDIMPLLATYNPNVVHNISRSTQLLADAHTIVIAQAEQDCQYATLDSLSQAPFQRVLDVDKLQSLSVSRQRQLLHYWLAQDEPLPPSKQLIDDTLKLAKRNDANHQTQLDWYTHHQKYRICRYRQQLYRLSHSFLEWLKLPIDKKTQLLSDGFSHDDAENTLKNIVLRSNDNYQWQLQFTPEIYAQLLKVLSNSLHVDSQIIDNIILKIAPLNRQQRIQTALATRPQSGKKLMQTLQIPTWSRDSLVVISVASENNSDARPLLLLSPFHSWTLGVDKANASIKNEPLDSRFNTILYREPSY